MRLNKEGAKLIAEMGGDLKIKERDLKSSNK